jgi:hypothetical protein
MSRTIGCAILAFLVVAGGVSAIDLPATIKSVDPDKGTVVAFVKGQDRTLTVAKDVKVLDKQGKHLPGGLKAKELQGAEVILSIEAGGGARVVTVIQLGGAAKPDPGKGKGKGPKQRAGDLQVGSAAPDFTVQDVSGTKTVTLSALRGKPVVLIFGSCT